MREVSHLEQLGTWSDPGAPSRALGARDRVPRARPARSSIPASPPTRAGIAVDALPETAFDHGAIVLAGRDRLRGKLSYSNIGFALAPETFTLAELRDVYEAALGYEVSATNLKRVLLRRGAIEAVGERRAHGPAGGQTRRALPLPRSAARGDRPVRRAPPAGIASLKSTAHMRRSLAVCGTFDMASRDRAREPRRRGDRGGRRVLARRHAAPSLLDRRGERAR